MLQPAVQPFVFRPHVEQDGITLTPDIAVHSVTALNRQRTIQRLLPSVLSSSPVIGPPAGGSRLAPACVFVPATFGMLVSVALVVGTPDTVVLASVARTAWRYPALQDHTGAVTVTVNGSGAGTLAGCLEDLQAAGVPVAAGAAGSMIVVPRTGAADGLPEAGGDNDGAISLRLEDSHTAASLTARFTVARG